MGGGDYSQTAELVAGVGISHAGAALHRPEGDEATPFIRRW